MASSMGGTARTAATSALFVRSSERALHDLPDPGPRFRQGLERFGGDLQDLARAGRHHGGRARASEKGDLAEEASLLELRDLEGPAVLALHQHPGASASQDEDAAAALAFADHGLPGTNVQA